jgi:putative addiction module CopG family antidote
MDITLTPDQETFIRQAVESGRFRCVEDAVTEALLLWEERELLRTGFRVSLDEAKASIARGEGQDITPDSMRQLAANTKSRLHARLAAETAAH